MSRWTAIYGGSPKREAKTWTLGTPIVNGSEAAIDVNHPLEVYGNEFG